MHWIIIRKRFAEHWHFAVIMVLVAFIAYQYALGNMQVMSKPNLGVYSVYDEYYSEEENFVMMRGHVTNYGSAYARDVKVFCRIDNDVETIKYWEYDAGDIPPRDQQWFVRRIDIPSSKVRVVVCRAECQNCG